MLNLKYREELNGLRAIAVIGVIIYHIEIFLNGNKVFPGGFLGVDIFFVISGYLITSLILKEIISTNNFSFKFFYFRRAKRILPALVAMIFISILFAWIYLTPKNFLEYSNSIKASLFFYSNYFFYFQDLVYNSKDSLLKPLLHTWSLAVEEQFYIFFPIFFFTIYKFIKKKLLIFFFVFLLVNFLISIYIVYSNSSFAFFSNFSRLWEILFGSLLAVLEVKDKKIKFRYSQFSPLIGFALILFSYLYFDKHTIHPSQLTLIPILGTFMIIHFIKVDDLTYKFLTIKFFSKIGLWSYSLYLWHYPVFAFARNRGKDLSETDKIELLVITFLISIISYYMIEKPFRNIDIKRVRIFFILIVFFSTVLVSFSYISKKNNGFEDRIHVFLKNITRENLWEKMSDQQGICFDRINNYCNFKNLEKKSIFLIGDSHAEVLNYSIYSRVKSLPFNYISANRGGCIYLPNYEKKYIKDNNPYYNCTLESKKNIDKLIDSRNNSIIIIAGDFQAHFTDKLEWKYISTNNKDRISSNKDRISSFTQSLYRILKNNKIILVYPIPAANFHVVDKIMNEVPRGNYRATEYLNNNKLTTNYSDHIQRNKKVIDFFDAMKHPNLYKVYSDEIFCEKLTEKKCFTHEGKNIFYSDKYHLSLTGAEMMVREIFKQLLIIDNLDKN